MIELVLPAIFRIIMYLRYVYICVYVVAESATEFRLDFCLILFTYCRQCAVDIVTLV